VEEPRIDDGIERSVEGGEFQCISDEKLRLESSFCSLLPGLSDRQGGGVDPEHFVPLACKKEDVIPRSTSDVQDGTRDLSCPGQFDELLLGAADVPGWRAPVDRVEDIHAVLWVEG